MLMTSSVHGKTLSRPFILASAALVLQIPASFAAEPASDAQSKAQAFLDPPPIGHLGSDQPASDDAARAGHFLARVPDAQQQARDFILGKTRTESRGQPFNVEDTASKPVPVGSSGKTHRLYADPQETVRRIILGERQPAARPTDLVRELATGSVNRSNAR